MIQRTYIKNLAKHLNGALEIADEFGDKALDKEIHGAIGSAYYIAVDITAMDFMSSVFMPPSANKVTIEDVIPYAEEFLDIFGVFGFSLRNVARDIRNSVKYQFEHMYE